MRDAEIRGGNRTAKKRMAVRRKVTGNVDEYDRALQTRRSAITGRIPDQECLGPKGS